MERRNGNDEKLEYKQLFDHISKYSKEDWEKLIGSDEINKLNLDVRHWIDNVENDAESDVVEIKNLLEILEKISTFIPWGDLKTKIQLLKVKIKKLYFKKPVILFQGRRGSGKSSLLNAILGHEKAKVGDYTIGTYKWEIYDHKDITMIDARGYGDPENGDAIIEEQVKEIVTQYPVDLILFTHKAEETSARLGEEIEKLNAITKIINDGSLVILPVMTQCDKIDTRAEFSVEDKLRKIEGARVNLYKNIKMLNQDFDLNILVDEILPVACEPSLSADLKHKWWYNVEGIIRHIFQVLPERSKVKFAFISEMKDIKEDVIDEVIFICSILTGIIGAIPVPFADLPVLAALQLFMVQTIRKISNSNRGHLTIAGTVVVKSGLGLKVIARSIAKLTGIGNVINGIVAYTGTYSIGKLAKKYYFYEEDHTNEDVEKLKQANSSNEEKVLENS